MSTTTFTKEVIKSNLSTNPKWIERALVVLYEYQTDSEKSTNKTQIFNDLGFNKPDSSYLSYCAKWVKSGRSLSGVHLTKCGQKLPKYWRQIKELIENK
jgi:hypothetical protein